MSWVGAVWLVFIAAVVAFITFTHAELLCQNRDGETTYFGRGYVLDRDADWIRADGRDRRLLSGESCIQVRAVGR